MLSKLKKSNNEGFTIIEVMIVLAIAALILLIVFLAIPALQRSSRNSQRRADAGRIAADIASFQSSNSGKLPTTFSNATTSSATNLGLGGQNYSIMNLPSSAQNVTPATSALVTAPAIDNFVVLSGATCTGSTYTTAASTRSAVVYYSLEGTTTTGCIDAGS